MFAATRDSRRAVQPPADGESLLAPRQVASGHGRPDLHHRFTDEEWLTPIQIARRLGYSTDKPIRSAIKRGELKAIHAPCSRKLLVAESEVLRWIDEDLAYEPVTSQAEPRARADPSRNGHLRPSGRMPSLRYDPLERGQP